MRELKLESSRTDNIHEDAFFLRYLQWRIVSFGGISQASFYSSILGRWLYHFLWDSGRCRLLLWGADLQKGDVIELGDQRATVRKTEGVGAGWMFWWHVVVCILISSDLVEFIFGWLQEVHSLSSAV